jgi:hypothetical protein
MSLSDVLLSPDEVVRRYVERVRADLVPDPLFRRRLRGVVTNRFVAAREGLSEPARRPSRMGRLGRACLYASFTLAMSLGGALAASRGAVPGDLLYPVKLQVEAIRLETFPEAFHDDLLVYALGERMAEFGRLVEEGDVARAAALAETIGAGYHELATMGIDVDSAELQSSLAVLQALSDRLPAPARAAVERAIQAAPGLAGGSPDGVPASTPPSTGGISGGRPAVAPIDVPRGPHVDRSGTDASGPPSAAPSPAASGRPTNGAPQNAGTDASNEATPSE